MKPVLSTFLFLLLASLFTSCQKEIDPTMIDPVDSIETGVFGSGAIKTESGKTAFLKKFEFLETDFRFPEMSTNGNLQMMYDQHGKIQSYDITIIGPPEEKYKIIHTYSNGKITQSLEGSPEKSTTTYTLGNQGWPIIADLLEESPNGDAWQQKSDLTLNENGFAVLEEITTTETGAGSNPIVQKEQLTFYYEDGNLVRMEQQQYWHNPGEYSYCTFEYDKARLNPVPWLMDIFSPDGRGLEFAYRKPSRNLLVKAEAGMFLNYFPAPLKTLTSDYDYKLNNEGLIQEWIRVDTQHSYQNGQPDPVREVQRMDVKFYYDYR